MNEWLSDPFVWFVLLGGVAVLVWHGATDAGNPEARRRRELERRLVRYPAGAGAVIVKAQRRRALWRAAPAVVLAVAAAFAMPYVQRNGLGLLCDRLGAARAARWIPQLFFPGLPALLLLIISFELVKAVRVLRGGYAPPLDSVLLHDTVAVTGWRAKLQGIGGLVFVTVAVGAVAWSAHNVRETFDDPRLQERIAARCSARPATTPGTSR